MSPLVVRKRRRRSPEEHDDLSADVEIRVPGLATGDVAMVFLGFGSAMGCQSYPELDRDEYGGTFGDAGQIDPDAEPPGDDGPIQVGSETAGLIIVANPLNDSELFSNAELQLVSAGEMRTLEALVDVILPATDSPAASAG